MHRVATPSSAQRIVLVVALGVALDRVATWVTTIGAGTGADFGWFGYAPLTRSSQLVSGGMPNWARLLVWLGFIAVWTIVALGLLRSRPQKS